MSEHQYLRDNSYEYKEKLAEIERLEKLVKRKNFTIKKLKEQLKAVKQALHTL